MAKTFTDVSSLLAAVNKEMMQAMNEIDKNGLKIAKKNAKDFYSQGKPKVYDRTGTYGDAPNSTGVQGGGNHLSTEIYMEESGHGYRSGSFSAREVWEAAENHTSGVLGKPGRWAQTEEEVEKLVNEIFAKHFE